MLSLFAFQLVSSGEKRKANGKERSLIPPCLPGEDQQVLRLVAALLAQDFGSRLPLRSRLLNASTFVSRVTQRVAELRYKVLHVVARCQRAHDADAKDLAGERTKASGDVDAVLANQR